MSRCASEAKRGALVRWQAQLNPKKKIFEELAPSLTTDAEGRAQYGGIPFMTTVGPVSSTVPNAAVR